MIIKVQSGIQHKPQIIFKLNHLFERGDIFKIIINFMIFIYLLLCSLACYPVTLHYNITYYVVVIFVHLLVILVSQLLGGQD